VNFEDENVWEHIKEERNPQYIAVHRFIECLGICHTIVSE
jgi:hypothetical protein